MKTIYGIVCLLLAVLTTQARPQSHPEVKLLRQSLHQRGDSLYLNLEMSLQARSLGRCQSWTITPQLSTADGGYVEALLPVVVNGNNKRKIYERRERFGDARWVSEKPYYVLLNAKRQSDMRLKYELALPFESWMAQASLSLYQTITSCADVEQLLSVVPVGPVVLEPLLVEQGSSVIESVDPQVDLHRVQAQLYLDFRVGHWVVDPSWHQNAWELAQIGQTLMAVRENPKATLTRIVVVGYASPEGGYAFNKQLGIERAEALKSYLSERFGLPASLFRVSSLGEDWAGLRKLVKQSRLPEKWEILAIIDSDDSADMKTSQLQSLGVVYEHLLAQMYPRLRKVECHIDYTITP